MVVGATNQRDLDCVGCAPQRLGGKEPTEARADDDNAMARGACAGHGLLLVSRGAGNGERHSCRPSHRPLFLKLDRCADYAKTAFSHEKYSQKESAAALLNTADELTFARILLRRAFAAG